MGRWKGFLYILVCPLLTWGTVYIQSGSEISECNMKCPRSEGVLELYRRCGGVEGTLLELYCEDLHTKNNDKTRLHLDTGSGCWKLTQTGRRDSCVYILEFHSNPTITLSSTGIRVLDPVLISNLTGTRGWLGEEMAVSIQFSGEESAVTWEVDGEPIPERYRLIDDNRTLIIPSVQRDDAERRFRVRITNPVSEEIREYQLEIRDFTSDYRRSPMFLIVPGVLVVIIVIILVSLIHYRKRDLKSNGVYEDLPLAEDGSVPPIQNGFTLTISVPQDVPLAENRSVPPIQNGSILTNNIGSPPATKNTFLSIERIEAPYSM